MHLRGEERVGGAHDRADVEVVLPVLDRDVELVPAGVEVGDDRVEPPVAVAVDDVAAVPSLEQLGVDARSSGHGARPRADSDLVGAVRHRVVRRARLQSEGGDGCWRALGAAERAHDGGLAVPVDGHVGQQPDDQGRTASSGNVGVSRPTLAARSSAWTTISISRVTAKSAALSDQPCHGMRGPGCAVLDPRQRVRQCGEGGAGPDMFGVGVRATGRLLVGAGAGCRC